MEELEEGSEGQALKNIAADLAEMTKKAEENKEAEEGAVGEKKQQQAMEECAFAELQLEGTKVVVESESVGQKYFGRQAVIVAVDGDEALLQFDTSGVDSCHWRHLLQSRSFVTSRS